MSIALKPCPFCGGEADYRTMGVGVYIKCVKCGCNTQTFHYKERQEAIKAWNRRPEHWHTGTPTEEGWYLVTDSHDYEVAEWDNELGWDSRIISGQYIVAWSDFPPYKGE